MANGLVVTSFSTLDYVAHRLIFERYWIQTQIVAVLLTCGQSCLKKIKIYSRISFNTVPWYLTDEIYFKKYFKLIIYFSKNQPSTALD